MKSIGRSRKFRNKIWRLKISDAVYNYFLGTKRSQILIYDTREPSTLSIGKIEFPVQERRPIVSMSYVPKCDTHRSFPCAGLLVMTLGKINKGNFT